MANEIEERIKKRKKRRNRRRLLSFLGFVLLIIYTPAIWNWFFSSNYEIGVIKNVTLEIKVPITGLLVRKETVFKSPGDGFIIPVVQNGGRVGKGNELASFIESNLRDIVDNYRQMEKEILKRVVAKFENTVGTERELWETAIENQISKLTSLSNSGNLSGASSIRNSIDQVLEAKARYMLEESNLNSIGNDKSELERLRSNINKSVESIQSSLSGIVSYNCDGYEEVYTPDKRHNISLNEIKEASEEQEADGVVTPAEISVKRDQAYCKIITNDEAWITFNIDDKHGKELVVLYEKAQLEGKALTYEIEVGGLMERIPVEIERLSEGPDNYMVTAKMTKYIEKTIDLRSVSGNLILQSVTGMQVPLRSLFNENAVDNTADIAIVEMNQAKFKRVRVVGRQDSYAVIENIDPTNADKNVNVFDIYLVNPKNVVEGQVVEK